MTSKSAFGLSFDVIEKINGVFRSAPEIDSVVLYGSRAMGTFKLGSDIDLTVMGAMLDVPFLLRLESKIEELYLPYKVDLSLHQKIDNPELLDHIRRCGVVFYKK